MPGWRKYHRGHETKFPEKEKAEFSREFRLLTKCKAVEERKRLNQLRFGVTANIPLVGILTSAALEKYPSSSVVAYNLGRSRVATARGSTSICDPSPQLPCCHCRTCR